MALSQEEKPSIQQKTEYSNIRIEDVQLGVWALRVAPSSVFEGPRKFWAECQKAGPLVWRLVVDIFGAAPYHMVVYLLCQLASGLEDLFLLGISDKLLRTIETGLLEGTPDVYAIITQTIVRLVFTLLFAGISWYSGKIQGVLSSKVTAHFQLLLMKSNLHLDLATSQEAASKSEANAHEAWRALDCIMQFIINILTIGSQITFIAHMSRSTSGPWFVLLSLSHPLLSVYLTPTLWDKVCFGYISNPIYQRIKALEKLADGSLRQDIISGGLAEWITDEYQRAHRDLGDLTTTHPFDHLESAQSLIRRMILEVVEFSPMILFAFNAVMNPLKFSLSSVATLQQSSAHLRMSMRQTLYRVQILNSSLTSLRNLYRDGVAVSNTKDTGIIPYPPKSEEKPSKGMSFELSDVCFSYPGAQTTTASLKDVSLKIKAGQFIVIVGANGSGKSTLVRILSRLYDSTSGTVDIDGRPSAEYIMSDLREATTLLSQDGQLYPLSLRENIGVGYPNKAQDAGLVAQAAEEGGATEFISKLKDGMNTVLEPILESFQLHLYNNKSHVLYNELESLRKKIDISGGERQKVVAARSFMRFRSGKIKFVAIDEPSSALDAEAELKLFENLIKVRDGKTLVFVTHRFGHLTKYADQIICMKEGSICESGSHEELMKKAGEYAKLYDIQASAFAQ